MSLLTDEDVKEIRLSIPAVCHHADLIRHTEKFIESKFSALRAENEAAIAAAYEQGKRDAVPEELRSLINKAQSHMMRTREADQVSVALTQYLIAAAPKQEK